MRESGAASITAFIYDSTMQKQLIVATFGLTCLIVPTAFAQTVNDAGLRVVRYARGFDSPTGIAFLDNNGTALVAEKNTGRIKLVVNRQITKTVLDLPVANDSERGLLSIVASPTFGADRFIYTYHTAAAADGGSPISNKVSRYRWNPTAQTLTLESKVLDLAPGPGPNHNGGKIAFDNNGKLFAVVGDVNRQERTQNFENSTSTGYSGAILRVQANGRTIAGNPFAPTGGARTPLHDIWGYGVRNSFGIAVDPVTNDLWDTENGPDRMDEINRVTPGFNSGWRDIMGPVAQNPGGAGTLVNLGSRANYQEPKLSWDDPVAPTDLEFVRSNNLGSEYRNDLIVGDVNTGSLYRLELTSNRKSLQLQGGVSDRLVNNRDTGDLLTDADSILFGSGFGITSDIITGPGGLYVLSLTNGAMYRISSATAPAPIMNAVPEPSGVMMIGAIALFGSRHRKK